jgi:urease accessory protein
MTTEILLLAQWLSPSYPVGAFAYSHGLETEIQAGRIASAADLHHWLADVLEFGSGHSDCILLRAAYACDSLAALQTVDATARAFSPCAERLRETLLQGDAFGKTTAAIWQTDLPDLTYPVAVGATAQRMGLDVRLTAMLFLQAFASTLVSVAVRLVPLGQTEGQKVLAALTPLCQSIAEQTNGATLDALQSTAFLSDIAAMNHETLTHRIFRS